jgi:hypothetical protein
MFVRQIDEYLSGWPDVLLTVGLLLAAAVAIWVALMGNPAGKAFTLAWMLVP